MKKFIAYCLIMVCVYPKTLTVMNSEFSTGTSDSPGYMVELSGMENGKYVTYTDYILSAGKLFEMGRITAPDKIEFIKGEVSKMDCD